VLRRRWPTGVAVALLLPPWLRKPPGVPTQGRAATLAGAPTAPRRVGAGLHTGEPVLAARCGQPVFSGHLGARGQRPVSSS